MTSSVFIPRKISIGFQNRDGTYTGKLAYVVYTDEKGVLRKKTSWETWRDAKIDPIETDNIPISGFVLNKRAGGYKSGYDMRQSYVRVYDPRGYEFEITIPNLVYILENVSCIKGKGLEGEFVYGWQGSELVLVPVDAPDYKDMISSRDAIYDQDTVKAKDLILGATYRTRRGESIVYMGRFEAYDSYQGKPRGKQYFFYWPKDISDWRSKTFDTRKSVNDFLVSVVDENPILEYASLIEKLECTPEYSPVEPKNTVLVPFTYSEFPGTESRWFSYFATPSNKRLVVRYMVPWGLGFSASSPKKYFTEDPDRRSPLSSPAVTFDTLEELFDHYRPQHRDLYLANGKFYRREF